MPFLKSAKSKAKKKENQKQKQQTELNRESGQRLIDALQQAEMSLSGIENKESRQVFKSILQTFAQYVDNAPVIGQYDVAEIDQSLLEMIAVFDQALKNGDLDTAKRSVERIHAGLADYRKELNVLELERQEEVLAERIEKLGEFKTVLNISNSIYMNRRNVEKKEQEYLTLNEKYNDLFELVEKQTQERPDLYEALLELRPGIDPIPEDAQEMSTNLGNLTMMADQVDDLKATMEIFRKEYNAQVSSLNAMETILTIQNGLLTKAEEERMNEAIDRYHAHLQAAIQEVRRLEELQEKRHIAIVQMMSSMSVGKSVMKYTQKFEALKRRRQLEQEGVARGIENQQELENDKQVITN